MSLITCENISLSYENNTVLSELSFTVEPGEYLCIVGENGSGKSTLIKALLGLKNPSVGKIVFGGGLLASEIGYLPQRNEMQLDFPASVEEVVLSGRLNSHGFFAFYNKADRIAANNNMDKLGISEIRKKSFSELSGGQRQRVLLARALCATKKLILLDEPAAGLDPVVTSELYSLIKEINLSGITVIMVSHDIRCALKYSTRILHLGGEHNFLGMPEEFIKSGAVVLIDEGNLS